MKGKSISMIFFALLLGGVSFLWFKGGDWIYGSGAAVFSLVTLYFGAIRNLNKVKTTNTFVYGPASILSDTKKKRDSTQMDYDKDISDKYNEENKINDQVSKMK